MTEEKKLTGYIDEDGCVFIEGRIKRMIVRYDDLEHGTGQLPVVFVVPQCTEEKHEIIEREIYQVCDNLLSKDERTVKILFLDSFPMTSASKIDYRKLERMLG